MSLSLTNSFKSRRGLTMIELLVSITIIAVLILVFIWAVINQQSKANDATRKADLEEIRVAFENYINDNDQYPPDDILDLCNSSDLAPYLNRIPCDPLSGDPYAYEPLPTYRSYRLYAVLQNTDDPIIAKLGCDGANGCGASSGVEFNYGIGVGVPVQGDNVAPTPSPSATVYEYACDTSGVCNRFEFGNPILDDCPITFENQFCDNACETPANQCDAI